MDCLRVSKGLHFHVLFESDSYALEKILEVVDKKFGKFFPQLKWINMGGGHLITRKGYDIAHLIKILRSFREKSGSAYNSGTRQCFCMGNRRAWWPLWKMLLKISGIKTAILDVSFTAHMPDCLEMPYKPAIKWHRPCARKTCLTGWEETHAFRETSWATGHLKAPRSLATE